MNAAREPNRRARGLRYNLAWTSSSALISQGSIFAGNIVFARILGTDTLADYLIVLTLATMIPAVTSLGVERLGVILLSNSSQPLRLEQYRAILRLVAASSLLAGLAAAAVSALSPVLSASDALTPALVASAIAAENFRIMLADSPRSWRRADMAALAGPALPRLAVLGLSTALFFWTGAAVSLNVLLIMLTVSSLAAALYATVSIRTLTAEPIDQSDDGSRAQPVAAATAIARRGIPLSIANLSLALLGQADILIVALFFEPAIVASYALISRTSNLLGNAKTMLNVALMPSLARRPKSPDEAHQQLAIARMTMSALFYVALPSAILLGLYAQPIFSFLFGAELSGAAGSAIWLLLGQAISVAMGLAGTILLRDARQVDIMWIQAVSAVLTVAAIFMTAASGRIDLVGMSSGLGTGFCAVLMSFVLWRRSGIRTWTLSPRGFLHTYRQSREGTT